MEKVFINIPYKIVSENLKRIKELDVGVEVYTENNLLDEISMDEVKELGKNLTAHGIEATVHAPFMDLSPGGYDKAIKRISIDRIKKAVDVAHHINAKGIVCHPGYDKWRFDGNEQFWLESSIETWNEVLSHAGGEMEVMLENIFEETPSTFIALFGYFRDKNLYFCFDTGHFNLFSKLDLDEWLLPLKNKIREMHIHDNHGQSDEHLPLGRGTFPFRELKSFIRNTSNIRFTTEFHNEIYAVESIKMLKAFLR
ncbi:MAG TPA: sugar phosphate isomerase/epimerase family protein [Syntrophorhabdaceae bacterium]|nr:sugar phosphate isomerase/epimerase family protein [Syntrophorhabdaceae bacterium]HPP06231.1 sugar phosphate isomerase/epimerase family protein [Syntrophorhabdaceae bacterium]